MRGHVLRCGERLFQGRAACHLDGFLLEVADHRAAREVDASLIGVLSTGDDVEQRRLAGAVGPTSAMRSRAPTRRRASLNRTRAPNDFVTLSTDRITAVESTTGAADSEIGQSRRGSIRATSRSRRGFPCTPTSYDTPTTSNFFLSESWPC